MAIVSMKDKRRGEYDGKTESATRTAGNREIPIVDLGRHIEIVWTARVMSSRLQGMLVRRQAWPALPCPDRLPATIFGLGRG